MSEPFIAEIKIFGGNFAPRGWSFCDGQVLPIAQNTALFSLIGTIYGGDGRTTTQLPDLQGRAPMHPGRGPGLTSRKLGQKTGAKTVTLSGTQIPSHTHALRNFASSSSTNVLGNTVSFARAAGGTPFQTDSTSSLVNMATEAVSTVGGGQSHNNEQPYLTLSFIIALVGTFPSRS